MLRMGRGFKTEAPEKEKQTEAAQQQQQPAPAPDARPAGAAAPTPAPPARVGAPAHEAPGVTPVAAATNTSRAVTESEALARDIKEGVMNGFVGSTTVLTGDAEFKGMLRVDGRYTGRISSEKGTLIVSAGGIVEANIAVATAKINGTVNGDIVATERIEFGRTAQVRGNIHTPSLVIEHGAIFEGNCRMRQAAPAAEQRPRNADTQPLRGKTPEKTDRAPFAEKPRPAATVPAAAPAEAVK